MVDNQTVEQICVLIRSLDKDNDSAYDVFNALKDHFGLAGAIWTDDDIVFEWKNMVDDKGFEPTQEQIKAVKDTSYWADIPCWDCSYLMVQNAIEEVMAEE